MSSLAKRIVLGLGLLLAIALTVVGDDAPLPERMRPPPDAPDGPRPRAQPVQEPVAVPALAKLVRTPPEAGGVDVFAAAGPAPRRAHAQPEPVAAPPAAPPLPFRYVGRIEGASGPTILLSRDNESVSARVGEALGDDYRLESEDKGRLTLVYLPLGERQVLDEEAQ